MSNANNVRNEIKQVAQNIETLAQQIQSALDKGQDIILTANELARNASTFVFTLGALYTLEQTGSKSGKTSKSVKTTTVSNPSGTVNRNYHNVRDSLGRFSRV